MNDIGPLIPNIQIGGLELSERQKQVMRYLEDNVDGLGGIYSGVLFALSQDGNPESLVQAAQSARELIKNLKKSFPGVIADASKAESFEKLGELSALYDTSPTDKDLRSKVKELDNYYKNCKIARRKKHEAFIEAADPGGRTEKSAKERVASELLHLEDWFSAVAHHGKPKLTKPAFVARFEKFENVVAALAAEYHPTERRLKQLMEKESPEETDVSALRDFFLHSALRDYFFYNLNNPTWFPLLLKAGYFNSPVDIEHPTETTIRCPAWPQSAYLLKCAPHFPKEITALLKSYKPLENSRVHQELVEIAHNLPAPNAADIALKAKQWIRDKYIRITSLPEALGKLVTKLAKESELEAAFILASGIIDLKIDCQESEIPETQYQIGPDAEAEAYVEPWTYQRMIEQFEGELYSADSMRFMKLLADKLNKALSLERHARGNVKEGEFYDYSYGWRPAIEDHEQNRDTDEPKSILLEKLRDHAAKYINGDTQKLEEILSLLEKYHFPLFKRLDLYLVAEKPTLNLKRIEEATLNFDLYEDSNTRHESCRLLESAFGLLDPSSQSKYFEWVKTGPDRDQLKSEFEGSYGTQVSEEQLDDYIEKWQLRRLLPVKHLPKDLENLLHGLKDKHGEQEYYDFAIGGGMAFMGPTSPITGDTLSIMPVKDVLEYLRNWQPPKGQFDPSPEGLGRELAVDVPKRAAEYVLAFEGSSALDYKPAYIYHLLMGLREAAKNKVPFDWDKALRIIETVAFASDLPDKLAQSDFFEISWKGVLQACGNLLLEGLDNRLIPFGMRERAWKLIERLLRESEPTLEYEAQYGGDNMSPVDMAINTSRGVAAHALFSYMLWVDDKLKEGKDEKERTHEIAPEAKAALEKLLDPNIELTLTVRSVIGMHLGNLDTLDMSWLKENLARIVPKSGSPEARFRDAAFEGYFSFSWANASLFKNLPGFFEGALSWAIEGWKKKAHHSARERFISQIANFYWWGLFDLDSPSSLLVRIFEEGSPEIRAHVFRFIGHSLEGVTPEKEGALDAFERLKELLTWRLSKIEERNPPLIEVQEELQEYGWWFAKGLIDREWLLDSLLTVLEATQGRQVRTGKVLERLLEHTARSPEKVAKALALTVQGAANPWDIDYWRKCLLSLFEAIKATGNQAAWDYCRNSINYLGDKGHREFGELL